MTVGIKTKPPVFNYFSKYADFSDKKQDVVSKSSSIEDKLRNQARLVATHCPEYWLQRVNEIMFRFQQIGSQYSDNDSLEIENQLLNRISKNQTYDFEQIVKESDFKEIRKKTLMNL